MSIKLSSLALANAEEVAKKSGRTIDQQIEFLVHIGYIMEVTPEVGRMLFKGYVPEYLKAEAESSD